jgi:P2-related tail formation protein
VHAHWNTKRKGRKAGPQRCAKKNSLRSLRRTLRPLRLINSSVEALALNYQAQPYDLSAAACCSAACLHAAAREPLVAGLSANFFQEARHCSTADLY